MAPSQKAWPIPTSSWCGRSRCGCPRRSPGSTPGRRSCAPSWAPISDMRCERPLVIDDTLELRVKRISYEADRINSYELAAPDGRDLVLFTAGAHIDLHLPNGMTRSYSLVNDQHERHRYVIAVNRELAGRGGSQFVHDNLRVGDIVRVSRP